jgi:hypothetical protein
MPRIACRESFNATYQAPSRAIRAASRRVTHCTFSRAMSILNSGS